MLQRFGAIGDIHAEDDLLRSAIEALHREGVDAILAVGDIADGRGSVDACVDALRSAGVIAVAGNHDRWLLSSQMRDLPDATFMQSLKDDTVEYLRELRATRAFETPRGPLLLCHGLGTNDMAAVRPGDFGYALAANLDLHALRQTDLRVVVNGHTHHRMVRRFGDLTVINAGTLKHDHDPGFLLVDLRAGDVTEFTIAGTGAVASGQVIGHLDPTPGDDPEDCGS